MASSPNTRPQSEEEASTELTPDVISNLGLIHIEVQRGHRYKLQQPHEWIQDTSKELSEVSEKGLKGKAVSNSVK